ncbi:CU044_5270 family protein [Phytohabitans sp. LJ34]|uniref:CU044_5270 family protein n=1 Tax=Phytohabitans sp. LJ34 TaxID=3452217 RepID=UPI003F8949A9
MSRDDSDIIAVRDLPPGRPEPTEESVSRTWHHITAARRPARTRATSRILVPAMAATLVAGLVVGGVLVMRPGGGVLEFGAPSDDKTSEPNLAPAPPQTVAVLHALAEAATHGPAAVKVPPGQYIFVRHDGWAGAFRAAVEGNSAPPQEGEIERQIREMWFDPRGMVTMSVTDGQVDLGADPSAERGAFEREGPSLNWSTPEWLASLPTDPERLRTKLRELTGDGGAWSTDHALWSTLQELYLRADLVLGPEVRAALLLSFTGLRGLTSSDVTVDGRRLVAVRHTERGTGDEILFDPATGQAVGRRTVSQDPGVTVTAPADAPKLDPGVLYQATWTQKVVAAVGAR